MQTGKIVPEQNKWPCVVDQIQSVRHAAFVNQSKQRNVIKVPLSCFNWKEQNNNGRINLVSEVSFLLSTSYQAKKKLSVAKQTWVWIQKQLQTTKNAPKSNK